MELITNGVDTETVTVAGNHTWNATIQESEFGITIFSVAVYVTIAAGVLVCVLLCLVVWLVCFCCQRKICCTCFRKKNVQDTISMAPSISIVSKSTQSNRTNYREEDDIYRGARGRRNQDYVNLQSVSLGLPPNWTGILSPESNHHEQIVPQTTREYIDVIMNFQSSLGRQAKNIQLTRIQHPRLHKIFEERKTELLRQNKDFFTNGELNEKQLYHGTSFDAIDNINSGGFNRSFHGKNGTRYGKGVYFAANAKYSDNYAPKDSSGYKYMYVCRVLTGMYTQGQESMLEPPIRKTSIKFDSVVDDLRTPSIFVIFQDDQAYPQYLIEYQ